MAHPKVQAAFSRHAEHYDQYAGLQRRVADQLIELVPSEQFKVHSVLDLGCGTGYLKRKASSLNQAQWTGVDLAEGMLQQARHAGYHELVQADVADLNCLPDQYELALSSLCYQWVGDLPLAFASLHQRMPKGGLFAFSTLLDGSLQELKIAWQKIDTSPHVNEFQTKRHVDAALKMAGFECVLQQQNVLVDYFSTVLGMLRALQGIGSSNQAAPSSRLTRGQLQRLMQMYEPLRQSQGLPLSYQVGWWLVRAC